MHSVPSQKSLRSGLFQWQQGSDPSQNLQQCLSLGERSDSKFQNQDLSSQKGSLLMIKLRWAIVFRLSLFYFFTQSEKSRKFSLLRAKLNQLPSCKFRSTEGQSRKTRAQRIIINMPISLNACLPIYHLMWEGGEDLRTQVNLMEFYSLVWSSEIFYTMGMLLLKNHSKFQNLNFKILTCTTTNHFKIMLEQIQHSFLKTR